MVDAFQTAEGQVTTTAADFQPTGACRFHDVDRQSRRRCRQDAEALRTRRRFAACRRSHTFCTMSSASAALNVADRTHAVTVAARRGIIEL
jgi:hypothetical protein